MKTHLTPDEKLRAAYAHLINGVDQHVIASLFGVNAGRVNEAIMVIRAAIADIQPVKRTRGRPRKGADK
jgi:transposase